MSRKLKFNLDVQANALLCPNPTEWFAKSYIQSNVVDNFKAVPGVKSDTKVSSNTFTNLIKAAGCSWAPVDTVLNAEDIDVCPVDVMVQICQYDLESSFVASRMAAGDSNWAETEFLNHFWTELSEAIEEEVQMIRWNGNTAGPAGFLKQCDGYLVKLAGASLAREYTAFVDLAFTSANIIGAIAGTVALLPEGVKGRQSDVRIYMSASNAFLYQMATLGLNSDFNYTGELNMSFAGYKIAVQPGMSNSYIVAGNKNSFVYAFDGEGDTNQLKIVNMIDTTAEPVLRVRAGFKIGFHILGEGVEVSFVKVGA